MKRIIALVLSAIVMISVFVVPSFATTKADLLTEAAKSPVYKYVKADIENAAKSVEITDEQADAILPHVQAIVAALNTDNGQGVYDAKKGQQYSNETVKTVMEHIKAICDILGWTYTMTPVESKPAHEGDDIFKVFDQNGKLVFSLDGEVVSDTSGAASTNWAVLAAGCAILVAGLATVVISRRKLTCEK